MKDKKEAIPPLWKSIEVDKIFGIGTLKTKRSCPKNFPRDRRDILHESIDFRRSTSTAETMYYLSSSVLLINVRIEEFIGRKGVARTSSVEQWIQEW